MRIVRTEFDYEKNYWVYLLDNGDIAKGKYGDARIPCGLNFSEVNQWGANQVFQNKELGI